LNSYKSSKHPVLLLNSILLGVLYIAIAIVVHGSASVTFGHRVAIFFGDSITYGDGASNSSHRWSTLVTNALNLQEDNQAISATVLQNTVPVLANNGRDRYQQDIIQRSPNYVYILYGLNDLRYNGANFSTMNFQNDLDEVVAGLISDGIPPSHIVIGSPPYINPTGYSLYPPYNAGSTTKHRQYRDATKAIARRYHTKWADVYQYMLNSGASTLVSNDFIHPNDFGHQAIKDAMLKAN
jgi:lysophospholipase L1-like esterase